MQRGGNEPPLQCFTEHGSDVTTDSGSNNTTDSDDVTAPSDGEVQNYSDNLYGSSDDTTSASFTIGSTGAVTTSGTYKQSDSNGFDDSDTASEPFADSEDLDGETLSDSGTDTETQKIDDVETDSASGSFTQYPSYLSTSGTYSESDSYSDDTDDSESGTGDDGQLYDVPRGVVLEGDYGWEGLASRSFSFDSVTQSSGNWQESGSASVSGGVTQSASGSSTETGTSETDYDAVDSSSGSQSVAYDLGEGSTSVGSQLSASSKELTSYSQSATFSDMPDGAGLLSTSNSLTFNSSNQTSNTSSESFTLSYGGPGQYEYASSTDIWSASDQAGGAASYAQSGAYTSAEDDGLPTADQNIGTTQSGQAASTVSISQSFAGTPSGGGHDDWTDDEAWLSGDSYQAQNAQTDAGNAGSMKSTSYSADTSGGPGHYASPGNSYDTADDKWTSDETDTVAVYTPTGGVETQRTTGIAGTYWWNSEFPPASSGSWPIDESYTSGLYTGGPGEIGIPGGYSIYPYVEPVLPHSTLSPLDLLTPTPGQYVGSNDIQPIATPPTPGPASPSPVNFANEESRGATDNLAVDDAVGHVNTDAGPLVEQAAEKGGGGPKPTHQYPVPAGPALPPYSPTDIAPPAPSVTPVVPFSKYQFNPGSPRPAPAAATNWDLLIRQEQAIVAKLNAQFGTQHTRFDQFTPAERARIEAALGLKNFDWEGAAAMKQALLAGADRDAALGKAQAALYAAAAADAAALIAAGGQTAAAAALLARVRLVLGLGAAAGANPENLERAKQVALAIQMHSRMMQQHLARAQAAIQAGEGELYKIYMRMADASQASIDRLRDELTKLGW